MTGPDPAFITQGDWKSISDLLFALWFILGSALGLGVSILLAHGMIPSLADTRDITRDAARRARPPLYGASLVFLGLALFGVILFIARLDAVTSIFYGGAQ